MTKPYLTLTYYRSANADAAVMWYYRRGFAVSNTPRFDRANRLYFVVRVYSKRERTENGTRDQAADGLQSYCHAEWL